MRRIITLTFAALLLVTTPGCDVLLTLVGLLTIPSTNLELMNRAENIVSDEYPNSMLIEAIGLPSSGTASTADDIDQWQFRFLDDPNAAAPGTVLLDYTVDNGFEDTVFVPNPLLGTVFERLPRQMTLTQAIEHMRNAGHSETFTAATLRKPLTFPQPEEALYIFSLPGKFVLVGALTGNVEVETP